MRRQYVVACCVLFAGIAIWRFTASWPREPSYKGRPLRYWVRGYRAGNYVWNNSNPALADDALRHIGTNAIPILLQRPTARDSPLDIKLLPWSHTWRRWAGKLLFVEVARIPHLRSYDAIEASCAFNALGQQASNAVPDLIRLLDQDLPALNHGMVILTLAEIGPPAKPAVPAIMRYLRAPDPVQRGQALYALGKVHPEPELVVTNATRALGDADPDVRMRAAKALQSYGADARSSVPALLDALQKWSLQPASPPYSQYGVDAPTLAAREALKAIDPKAAAQARVK
jgi:hypothetical protein